MNLINYFFQGIITIIKLPFFCIKYLIIGLITILSIIPHYIIIGIKYLFSKKEKKDKNPDTLENKFIPIIIITLSITTYLLSVFILTRWYVQNERTKNFTNSLTSLPVTDQITENTSDQYQELTNSVPQEAKTQNSSQSQQSQLNLNYINVNLDYYISKNPETVAWIQVNGTKVNYPIVQHTDNEFYLNHDFYQRNTNIGWIFADYRDDFETFNNNTIIYGHNLINRTMFGTVPYLVNKNWFNTPNREYIKLSTKTTNSIWQIFSVYKIEPTTDYLQSKFNSTETYQTFLNKIKNRSTHNFNIDVVNTDKIITLSTCDDIGTKRVVVHAKLIRIENK